ncbi:peripheral Golgi membrane protein [Encephalitozoon intestinalis ATCC 50506]|uniref:Peripheral Golgi membrane protein n=1 Tax=Encephalitozoon intestinalis (strain ATCC 50506) TaxID=876142 RepID=E0S5B8_ENCIT|nr:peripheral Golgi membrane protein [Encephalitozoon intestinalis ATCC 50506]ADM10903.1 peripheral Golgi membrane protein [Encephalitozoon intestinalis ATCC 50506]UTX44536.1 GRASP5/65 PDZ-like domain-containing protein [Encephalitozoon intestinalis]
MGSCLSTIKSLQILKVSEGSVSHKNGILPFIHSIVGFNGKAIESKDDALIMNKEWERKALQLELIDMRTMETSVLEIPKKDKTRLGISVKFHQNIASLLSMEVLRVNSGSPAEKAGMVVGDYILGIENIYSKDEDDLLRFLELNRRRTVPLFVYNNDLEYVRVVYLQVGMDILLGCQVGIGELYKVPFNPRRSMVEFNSEITKNDVKRLRRKLRGKDIISSRLRDVVSGNEIFSESVSSTYVWDAQEKTPSYDFMSSDKKKGLSERVSSGIVRDSQALDIPFLDMEDANEIPVILPESLTYEVPIDRQRRVDKEESKKSKSILSILEHENDDNFDFEGSLSLVRSNGARKKEREKEEAGKREEPKERAENMPQEGERNDEVSEAFFLPIEKGDSQKDEFDARNFLSSLSLSFYGTDNGYDSGSSQKTVVSSSQEGDNKCPLCFECHQEEHTVFGSEVSGVSNLETSYDAEDNEEREEFSEISPDVFNSHPRVDKVYTSLDQFRVMEGLESNGPYSEEDSRESANVGSPPYSDPGSIL